MKMCSMECAACVRINLDISVKVNPVFILRLTVNCGQGESEAVNAVYRLPLCATRGGRHLVYLGSPRSPRKLT